MQPRKDYDDYTSFINDTYAEEKGQILTQENNKKLHFRGKSAAVSPNGSKTVAPNSPFNFDTVRGSAPEPLGATATNQDDRFKTMRSYYSSLIKQGPQVGLKKFSAMT